MGLIDNLGNIGTFGNFALTLILSIPALISILNEFQNLPIYMIVIIFIIVFIAFYFILRFLREYLINKKLEGWTPLVFAATGQEYDKFQMKYSDVIWDIKYPLRSVYQEEDSYLRTLPKSVKVITPPRCPICKTELKQSKSTLGKYKWYCVGCKYSKKSKDSFLKLTDDVKKLAKREVEKEIESESKGN